MTREDRYPDSNHERPSLWACFTPTASGQQRNEVLRNASKNCLGSGWQLSGEGRA